MKLYYRIKLVELITRPFRKVVSLVMGVILIAVAAWWNSLVDTGNTIAEHLLGVTDGDDHLVRVISYIIAFSIWVFMAYLTVWLISFIQWAFR